jgi:hypothetical protein
LDQVGDHGSEECLADSSLTGSLGTIELGCRGQQSVEVQYIMQFCENGIMEIRRKKVEKRVACTSGREEVMDIMPSKFNMWRLNMPKMDSGPSMT